MNNSLILTNVQVKQTKGLKRNITDKYYTKISTVNECIEILKKYLSISFEEDLIIEPSAGNGAFIEEIKKLSSIYLFYDIEPHHEEIIKQNYLDFDEKIIENKYKEIHIIGNPPFGRQSSLAIKFIKKSCKFCDSISFILPKSFKKDSMKSCFKNNFHLLCQVDLPDKAFLVNEEEYTVPCVFQIWKKKDVHREPLIKLKPVNFTFVNKIKNPDISFRRVGVNSGIISQDIDDKSEQSHYFIKFMNEKNINDNIELLNKIKYYHDNTVGPRSISKQELIKEFNIII